MPLTEHERTALRAVQLRHKRRMVRLFMDYAIVRHPYISLTLCFAFGLALGLSVILWVVLLPTMQVAR